MKVCSYTELICQLRAPAKQKRAGATAANRVRLANKRATEWPPFCSRARQARSASDHDYNCGLGSPTHAAAAGHGGSGLQSRSDLHLRRGKAHPISRRFRGPINATGERFAFPPSQRSSDPGLIDWKGLAPHVAWLRTPTRWPGWKNVGTPAGGLKLLCPPNTSNRLPPTVTR